MKKNHIEYQESEVKALITFAAKLIRIQPSLAADPTFLWTKMVYELGPKLGDPGLCPGCQRSMKITIYEADLLDALLILAMAREVKNNKKLGMSFTEANKVHLPTLATTQGILKRQTKCDYLGLIKQPENWRGSGYWLLTGWAWKALRGESIPKAAKYWEGKLIGRSEAIVTLNDMFKNHTELVQQALAKRKAIKTDRRSDFADYNPRNWAMIDGDSEQMRLV
jgi:hypothetical protein